MTRVEIKRMARHLAARGLPNAQIAAQLMAHKVPRSTAFRYARRAKDGLPDRGPGRPRRTRTIEEFQREVRRAAGSLDWAFRSCEEQIGIDAMWDVWRDLLEPMRRCIGHTVGLVDAITRLSAGERARRLGLLRDALARANEDGRMRRFAALLSSLFTVGTPGNRGDSGHRAATASSREPTAAGRKDPAT